jgi:hypothetical protein
VLTLPPVSARITVQLPAIVLSDAVGVGVGFGVGVGVEVEEGTGLLPPHPLMTIAREKTIGRQGTKDLRIMMAAFHFLLPNRLTIIREAETQSGKALRVSGKGLFRIDDHFQIKYCNFCASLLVFKSRRGGYK